MGKHVKLVGFVALLVGVCSSPGTAWGHDLQSMRDCSGYVYVPAFPAAPANYAARYHTVAHQLLDEERGVGPVNAPEYAILDAILDDAQARLKPIPKDLPDAAYETFAVESLKAVDCILVSHGFVYPGTGLVQLLSDGLDPTMFADKKFYTALLDSPHNSGRMVFIEERKPGPYYVVDCDIASYLYLAIGEIMGYPLSMVQLPLHNFVRWKRPNGGYIDFETMDGKETDDDYYYAVWHIPQKFVGTLGVLTTMTNAQLLAYHDFTVAIAFTWKHDYPTAIAEYEKSISVDPTLGDAANNLAWLYTVVPDPKVRDPQKAAFYARKSVAIFANGDSLDTLACAYGLAGNFPEAVAEENRAIQIGWAPQGSDLSGDLRLLSASQTCQDPTFGTDPHPFRPTTPVIKGTLAKDANALH